MAWLNGFKTGGTAPLGYRTDEGPMPELLRDKYGLEESWSPGYRVRTIQNVRSAELTVWFGDPSSPGGRLTIGTCLGLNRAHLINPTPEHLLGVLHAFPHPLILNGAGNRKRTNPTAALQATETLRTVLAALKAR